MVRPRTITRPLGPILVAAIGAAAVLSGCGGGRHAAGRDGRHDPGARPITVDATACAPGWRAHAPGAYVFAVDNRSDRGGSVQLTEFGTGAVVARVAESGPATVTRLRAKLAAGHAYQWSCALQGSAPRLSATVQLAQPAAFRGGGGRAGPVPAPVATVQLIAPLSRYRIYVSRLLARDRSQIAALRARIAGGDIAGARAAWLTAHLTWLRIGEDDGAYGAFGDLGRRIDGTAAGLVGGTSSPAFTGFHKVELDLFQRRDRRAAGRDAAQLARLVGSITAVRLIHDYLPPTTAAINAWTLRCHEILEDALRDSLSGDDDYGSHSDLAAIGADAAATREMLSVLAPLLVSRAHGLVPAGRRELTAISTAIAAAGPPDARRPLRSLGRRRRQDVDAAVGGALQTLAPVSELMQVGTT